MKYSQVVNEERIPITGATSVGKRYVQYKKLTYLILDEGEPPDVHGIPQNLEAYGRGWVDKNTNTLEVDGGPQGSRTGHPASAINGFYWGVDQDANWTGQDGVTRKGILYVRGRAGTSQNFLKRNIQLIMNSILKLIPSRNG